MDDIMRAAVLAFDGFDSKKHSGIIAESLCVSSLEAINTWYT